MLINRRRVSPRVFETIHFRVMNDAAFLHSLIMSATYDFSVMHQHRTNRNAARRQAFFSFLNRRLHKWVHHPIQTRQPF